MKIRIQRHGLVPAVVVTVLGVLALYLASTRGWAALQDSGTARGSGVGTLPQVVQRAPSSVATTEEYGPLGAVSVVYAGTLVQRGLFGELDPVWLAVSARDGDTRALSVEGLPPPAEGAVSVSPQGDRLAWVAGDAIRVYDTGSGEVRALPEPGVSSVGAFSPDGSHLLAGGEGLVVVDTATGEAVSRFVADDVAIRRAAWRTDGSAVDFVEDDELVTGRVPGSSLTRQPTDIPERSEIAWSPAGDRLASLQPVEGVRRLFVSSLGPGARVGPAQQVALPGVSVERLVGFSGPRSVAVVAFALDTGGVERMLDVPLDGGTPDDLTSFPDEGENWAGTETLAVASSTLRFGSTEFDEPVWPWSHLSRLVACVALGVFLLGLFVTRRRR